MLFKWILSFLGRSELPKKEIDIEEGQSLMDDNRIGKGFYFVLLWSLIKPFIVLFSRKLFNKNYFSATVKKIFKFLLNTSSE